MLTFPKLKTGSAVQYPFGNTRAFSNDVLMFLGGDEQRYRTAPSALQTWELHLALLDEGEMREVEVLFQAVSGTSATFSFTDATTGVVYPSCYFKSGDLSQMFEYDFRSGTSVLIQESRS